MNSTELEILLDAKNRELFQKIAENVLLKNSFVATVCVLVVIMLFVNAVWLYFYHINNKKYLHYYQRALSSLETYPSSNECEGYATNLTDVNLIPSFLVRKESSDYNKSSIQDIDISDDEYANRRIQTNGSKVSGRVSKQFEVCNENANASKLSTHDSTSNKLFKSRLDSLNEIRNAKENGSSSSYVTVREMNEQKMKYKEKGRNGSKMVSKMKRSESWDANKNVMVTKTKSEHHEKKIRTDNKDMHGSTSSPSINHKNLIKYDFINNLKLVK